MVAEGKIYGTTQIMPDALDVQIALASNVSTFMSEYRHLIPTDANLAFQWRDVERALEGKANHEAWTRLVFYVSVYLKSRSNANANA